MSRKKTKWTDEELGWLERRQAKPEEYWHEIEDMNEGDMDDFLCNLSMRQLTQFIVKFYAAKLAGNVSDGVMVAVRNHIKLWVNDLVPVLRGNPKIEAIMERRRCWALECEIGGAK
jgi:hypothetical protein